MSGVLLVQPKAGGRISGGYLYNERMAAHGAWDLIDLDPPELDRQLAVLGHELVLADSIWLASEHIAPFLRLRARGIRAGVLLHSFPSMIAAAESGLGAKKEPTAFELDAIAELGLVVLPGPHYVPLVSGRADVRVVPPGIDDEWRAPPRPRGERCALVSVGAVTRRKGFLDVVRALESRPRRDDYAWFVVGSLGVDAEYADEVRRRAERVATVDFLGQKSPDETRAIVQEADVLVMPSYDENHPLVLLEAMAASVPAVAYSAGAAAEIVQDGQTGLVVPIGDVSSLGARIEMLVGDEGARFRLAQNCWGAQRGLPNWVTAARHAKEVLASGGSRRT